MIYWCTQILWKPILHFLTQVFQIIQHHKFLLKLSKCSFAQTTIEYLGHCISAEGVSTEPSKVEAVQNWPIPTSLKELRGFLGLTGFIGNSLNFMV